MAWAEGSEAVPAADSADWIDAATGAIFDYDLWEPGFAQVRHIKIANEGSLALKYRLQILANGEVSDLADVIDVYYVDPAQQIVSRQDLTPGKRLGTLTEVLAAMDTTASGTLEAGKMDTVTIALKMQETAGNEYQGKEIGSDFSVVLLATQQTSESDSFGKDYDTGAEFPSTLKPGQVSAPVTVANGVVAEAVTLQGDGISASVPAGVAVENGARDLVLSITPMAYTTSDIDLGQEEVLVPVDVHIEGVAEGNTVPIIIELGEVMPKYLNMGNHTLIHIEDGVNQPMTLVDSAAGLTAHNTYTYDPATGAVTVAMASFSEVALIADTANVWQGSIAEKFAGGTGTEADPYLIANADQLALMNEKISNENETYGSAHYRVIANIDLGSGENAVFYPIGYHKIGGGANQAGETWYTYGGAFSGTFDGNGHIITGITQRTWDMDGDYDYGYWKAAMGLFGYVYNGTVKNLVIDNFYSEGEFAPTGCITAYAAGESTFENIAIINSHPQTYNTGVAGIVGWDNGGDTEEEASNLTFNNITVDETTTVSALWGSRDVGAAGILGYLGEYSKATFNDCSVSATIDVYNDVCGNYQYYWYRYCGAFIGTVDRRYDNGKGDLDLSNVTAKNCTVAFGDRHEYYYCEFEKNTQASYTDDYQFSRIDHADLVYEDGKVVGCNHYHTENEDKQAVHIPFRQLFGGYGWGVDGVDLDEYDGIKISDITTSVEKFEAVADAQTTYDEKEVITIGDLFKGKDTIREYNVQVTVSPADEHSTVTGTYKPNTTDWTQGTLTLKGVGDAIITISDYNYCLPTTIQVNVKSLEYFANGDFSDDALTLWEHNFTTNGRNRVEIVELDGERVLKLNPSTERWSAECYLRALSVEPNTTYTLSFDMKGAPIDIFVSAGVGHGWKNISKCDDWTRITITFTTKTSANNFNVNYVLAFTRGGNLSSNGELNTASLGTEPTYLDNISLVKVLK